VTVIETQETQTRADRVTLHEPDAGWSADAYKRELESYVERVGRAPQTVTMHPATANALGLGDEPADAADGWIAPFLVTSPDYARRTITFYY
jgi:hypothetical protein